MPTTKPSESKLPGRFRELVRMMPPQAIADDVQLDSSIEMIDRLMASGTLTKGQQLYLETLVQLVEAYERDRHAIDTSATTGLESLRYLLDEHSMNASDLGRLLNVHVSLGSKILAGDRSLTVEHMRKLAAYFNVRADLFM